MNLLRKCIHEMLSEISLGRSHGAVKYTALVLDDESHHKLSVLSPPEWNPVAHHMTIINPPNQKLRMPSRWLGAEECVKIISIAKNDQVMTGLVDLGDLPIPMKGPAFPHVTIAINSLLGGKASMSNLFLLSDFESIEPISICGIIEEIL